MRILSGRGDPILCVEDWFAKAPPKQGAKHWKDYRSAKELAKAWFRKPDATPPDELLCFLQQSFPGNEISLTLAYPERVVPLDTFGGEHRNTDLLVLGNVGFLKVAISIEAKADEPFGDHLVGEYYDRRRSVPGSNVCARIDGLSRALFNTGLDAQIRSLRYQLLHATAGALIAAKKYGAEAAIFLVHKFISNRLNPSSIACNDRDWRTFVAAIGKGREVRGERNYAIGPLGVAGGEYVPSDIPLYLGMIEARLP
jgi:hypothetical protein